MQTPALPVAIPRNPPTLSAIMVRGFLSMLFLALCGSSLVTLAADGDPVKPRYDEPGRPERGPGGKGFGMPPGGMRDTGWDQLTETEKKRLREALDKVWESPEVAAAREKIMKATEEMRGTLRMALEKNDPEAAKIMAKVKTPFPWPSHRGPPPLPKPEDPNFSRLAAMRLGFEMMSMAKPEQREALRHLHERVVELPAVKAAITKIESAPVGERLEAFKAMRDIYKKECEREIADFKARRQRGEEKK
jgi:hypothetical protein